MPMYEFICRACETGFERLLRHSEMPLCPACQSPDVERCYSTFAVNSDGTRAVSLNKARRANSKEVRDKQVADAETYLSHQH